MLWVYSVLLCFAFLGCIRSKTPVETAEKSALRNFFESSNVEPLHSCPVEVVAIGAEKVKDFSVFSEIKLKYAKDLINNLVKFSHEEMMRSLVCLKRLHGKTAASFVDFVLRGCFVAKSLMKEFPGLSDFLLPPNYQTLPHFFFSPENMALNESVAIETSTSDDPEKALSWWREDTGLGEHHCNWHHLNNFILPVKHREGELFAYMHLQMLARYDMERIALGYSRVVPFGPGYGWDKPLSVGYNPKLKGMSFRPINMKIGPRTIFEGQVIDTDRIFRNKDNLYNALSRGFLEHKNGSLVKINLDVLGNAIEANTGNINRNLYGNIHNDAHNIIGSLPDPLVIYDVGVGAMTHAATAPRDPVFFSWHKFIDKFFEAYRKTQKPYALDDLYMKDIEIKSIKTISHGLPNTMKRFNHLYTFMERGKYTIYDLTLSLEDSQKSPIHIYKDQLNHVNYKINVTVSNSGVKDKQVIFRVFMALKTTKALELRRDMFIEVDKFVEVVPPGTTYFTRRDDQSSVAVQAGATMEEMLDGKQRTKQNHFQKCGWPGRLLLPRSTTKGMDFDLYVIATDWEEDRLHPDMVLHNGASYCGMGNAKVADSRPMGFPFDRRFDENTKFNDFANLVPNSAATNINIKFLEDFNFSN